MNIDHKNPGREASHASGNLTRQPQPRMLTWEIIRKGLSYILKGKMVLHDSHLPLVAHDIPLDFAGVGVAASDDPAVDHYILQHLTELGIRQVRLDFSYADIDHHAARLLDALLKNGFNVLLHLVQPFDAAINMEDIAAQETWRTFLQQVLALYGHQIAMVEIGSTINRKRWAGYTPQGFLKAWEIAHEEVRKYKIKLAGPNISDFEPLYNIGLLDIFQQRKQLPDVHTNNLFCERTTEPERYDHRILKVPKATALKFNLIKKARLLHKITRDHGVQEMVSPAAFWTLPRILRLLPDGEQKQADYLARYMILCAASGALRQAFWGPLICYREGLIDDGSNSYPALERITHYASVTGQMENFRPRPSFHAMKTFAHLIPGRHYAGLLRNKHGLEIHVFSNNETVLHAVWTTNGKGAVLADHYHLEDLQLAQYTSRDGELLASQPGLASESPIYISWPLGRKISLKTEKKLFANLSIQRHAENRNHHVYQDAEWRGIFVAGSDNEVTLLQQALHPSQLGAPPKESILRKARNAIWTIPDPRDPSQKLVVKQPVKMHLHKKLFDQFKLSKAKRSWNGTNELLRRGISAAPPVAYLEKHGDRTLLQNYYICEFVDTDFSIRDIFGAFNEGQNSYKGVTAEHIYPALTNYLLNMHTRGVFFRDLSGGNILVTKQTDGTLDFSLIDTNRAHFYNHATPLAQRLSDLTRVCVKLPWSSRHQLVGLYLKALGLEFGWRQRLPFHLYDFKVGMKKRVGRKALKRLFKKK
ncbi:Lipopolysaccharide kinase (Kdo/WaaP) family protein [Methylobacillus rhizosphaerae]|uniref:Lipopolysaccharide kinase (Kdo/WaaP) family protein n=1 Tax=Methylobacillus rhizosphaerae TaxID=551994 RepID=A0A238YNF6_9PROT|nr:lipopolysaccharide kinase InaA family protein [Methylobacillus rhizosphaerae]SNR72184.1 Lipopolysaccharide kinase (Kdo/WaaP) family protein [Methylobacillus rhizosphaerae]